MKGRKRLRREPPARAAPIRDFSNLYRGRVSSSDRADNERERVVEPPPSGPAPEMDSSAEGIALAYRIIEKNIREGRDSAAQLNRRPYGDLPKNEGLGDLLERLFRSQVEVLPLWLDVLGRIVNSDPASGSLWAGPGSSKDSGAATDGSSSVAIELLSSCPVQVSLDLRERSAGLVLETLGLRSIEAGKPELTDVAFVPGDANGSRKLRIRIPDGQPTGTYSGVIVESTTGQLRGTLTVHINQSPDGSAG